MDQRILLVDDDPAAIRVMSRMLAGLGAIQFATNGQDALRLSHVFMPGVIVLDANMPGMSGLDVCSALKADPATEGIPVIFVTSNEADEFGSAQA